MKTTPIPEVEGAYVIDFDRHNDHRGYFQEVFSSIRYDANLPHVAQVNVSNSHKHVVRGLHVAHFNKLCTCVKGALFDVVVDVRKGSETFGKWAGIWLTDLNCKQVFVPAGCAHGFYAAEDDTLLLYSQDGLYNPKLEWTLHWKDPIVDVRWPVAETYNVSEKDQRGVYLGDALEVLRG